MRKQNIFLTEIRWNFTNWAIFDTRKTEDKLEKNQVSLYKDKEIESLWDNNSRNDYESFLIYGLKVEQSRTLFDIMFLSR